MKSENKSKKVKWLCVNVAPTRQDLRGERKNFTVPGSIVEDSRGQRYVIQRAGNLVRVDK